MVRWTTSRKVAVGCICGLVAVAAAVTLGYSLYFAHRALPNTMLGDTDVSGQSEVQLRQSVTNAANAATLSITVAGEKQQATLADLGYTVNVDGTLQQVLAPNSSWTHRVGALFGHATVEPVYTHSADALSAYASSLTDKYGTPPVNATVKLDGTTFTATADESGKGIDADMLASSAAQMATTLKSADIDLGVVDLPATVTQAAAQSVADKANAMVATSITLSDGKTNHSPKPADIASWITVATDDDGTPTVSVDATKVTAWVQSVADSVKVGVTNGVHNVDASGKIVSTPTTAVDGRTVNNVAPLASDIVKAVQSATAYSGTFTYDVTKATYTNKTVISMPGIPYQPGPDELWIDVNLTTYKVTVYKGNQVQYGPVTVSIGRPTRPTIQGVFHIYLKYANQTMYPKNDDGTPAPPVPNVQWVSYFTGSYALHAAWWLNANQWGTQVSHGCVNMKNADAKWIYDNAPIGTTVVTHT